MPNQISKPRKHGRNPYGLGHTLGGRYLAHEPSTCLCQDLGYPNQEMFNMFSPEQNFGCQNMQQPLGKVTSLGFLGICSIFY